MLMTKEFYDIMSQFEKSVKNAHGLPTIRTDKEPKELWKNKVYYTDGFTNQLFIVYLMGYAYSKSVNN